MRRSAAKAFLYTRTKGVRKKNEEDKSQPEKGKKKNKKGQTEQQRRRRSGTPRPPRAEERSAGGGGRAYELFLGELDEVSIDLKVLELRVLILFYSPIWNYGY